MLSIPNLPMLAPHQEATLIQEATLRAKRRIAQEIQAQRDEVELAQTKIDERFLRYQNDPHGFGADILKEKFAPGIVRVMRSVRENPITIARSANAIGKTHGAARIATWFYKCFPGAQVYTTAAPPVDNLKLLLWGEIGKLVYRNPNLFTPDIVSADMHIKRNDFEFITGVVVPSTGTIEQREARFGGKHAPYILFIIDEGDAVPEYVYRAIDSCMSGGFARMLIMFNPRMKSGYVFRKEKRREAKVIVLNALEHPNVITGNDIFPGAVTREVTVRRIHELTRPVAPHEDPEGENSASYFEVPLFLEGAVAHSQSGELYPPLVAGWRKIEDPEFYYKVLGVYPPAGSRQLINEDWIENAVTRWKVYVAQYGEKPPANATVRIGLDVGEYGDDPSVAIERTGGFVSKATQWSGVDTTITGDRAIVMLKRHEKAILFVDSIGVGAGVPGYVFRKVQAKRNQIVSVRVSERPTENTGKQAVTKDGEQPTIQSADHNSFGTLRDQLWWTVREWLRLDPGAMLPPDETLREELLVATYEPNAKGEIKVMEKKLMKERLGHSPNVADALCLTFAPDAKRFRLEFV